MSDGIGRILREHDVAGSILPPAYIAAILAAERAIDSQGYVRPGSLLLALRQHIRLEIRGTAIEIESAALPDRVPSSAVKVRLDAYAVKPPSGGPFVATVHADGEPIGTVKIGAGVNSGGEATIAKIPVGAWLNASVEAANGAANISIVITYRLSE
jgi:hypothetical protein